MNLKQAVLWSFALQSAASWAEIPGASLLRMAASCHSYYSDFRQKNVGYCLDRSRPDLPQQAGEPVVYFMNGVFFNSRQWFESGFSSEMRDLAKAESWPAFTVVSFNTAAMSFYSDEGDVPTGKKAYETWFVQEFIPTIQKKFPKLCSQRGCRGIAGSSMGGFGSLKTALRHPDLFMLSAASEPAILPDNIYNRSLDEWGAYFKEKPIGKTIGIEFIKTLQDIFPTAANYDENDPVVLIDRFDALRPLPAIYFDVTGGDQFGFYDGFHRFEAALQRRGFPYSTTFDPNGNHFSHGATTTPWLRFMGETLRGAGY
ncbi:MAG: hypothetical protein JST16_12285 [Bdellovibrionales bacterium]|nr:hypothetical protein [Bdellovibrionales bacterium]